MTNMKLYYTTRENSVTLQFRDEYLQVMLNGKQVALFRAEEVWDAVRTWLASIESTDVTNFGLERRKFEAIIAGAISESVAEAINRIAKNAVNKLSDMVTSKSEEEGGDTPAELHKTDPCF